MLVVVLSSPVGKRHCASFDGVLLDARSNVSYRTNFDSQNRIVSFHARNPQSDSQIA